jgi:hypothetical protein
MPMSAGDTFLMSPRAGVDLHLWIVITAIEDGSGLLAVVSITTLRHNADQTLILRRGDHPFIRHDSVVHFADARLVELKTIEGNVAAKHITPHEPCSAKLIREVQDGALGCDLTPQKVFNFCKKMLGR